MGVGAVIDTKVTAAGKAMSRLLWTLVIARFFPILNVPVLSNIILYFLDRIMSLAHDFGLLTFNMFRIESSVDEELIDALAAWDMAIKLPKDATNEQKNKVANLVIDKASQLWSNHRPNDKLFDRP